MTNQVNTENVALPTQYQQYIGISRYAKWLEPLKRREYWGETPARYCNYFNDKYEGRFKEVLLDEIQPAIINLDVMPSMRALMTAGPALDVSGIASYNCAYLTIDNKRAFSETLFILMNGTGVGFSCERQEVSRLPVVPEFLTRSEDTIVVADSKLGWAKAFKKFVSSLYEGDIPTVDYSGVRPAGARLKTFGGRASGPEPLRHLFSYFVETFRNAAGRKLNSLEVHDLMCVIGDVVVVGGVRRSALISLSNLSDQRMRDAKAGQWWIDNGQRKNSNNSVAYTEKPDMEIFMEEWLSLVKSKSGERGIFNRVAAQKQASRWGRRSGTISYGANPCCFTGDMKLLTTEGYTPFKELVDKSFCNININGQASTGKVWSNGYKDIVELKFRSRESIFCTPDHIFKTLNGLELSASNLNGHRLMPYFTIKNKPIVVDDFKVGFIFGDGALCRINSEEHLGLEVEFGYKDKDVAAIFGKEVGRHYEREYKNLAVSYGLKPASTFDRELPEVVSEDFMMGVYSANGCVIKSANRVALKTASKNLSIQVSAWLLNKGIKNYITTNKPTEVLFSNGLYTCKESYDVNVTGHENLKAFASKVSFIHEYKQELLEEVILNTAPLVSAVVCRGCQEVFDFNEPLCNWGVVEGVQVHNCEILLRPKEFCNLTEVVIRPEDTLETLKAKVRLATIMGTFQAAISDFNFLSEDWKKNCEEERLLGVSLTGIMDHKVMSGQEGFEELKIWLNTLRDYAREVNLEWATLLGINPAAAITCGKPSGTVSQLTQAASGIHPRHSQYYLRTVRNDKKDPLYQFLKDQGIYVEDDVTNPNDTAVFYFPIKSPDGCITRDMVGAMEQLRLWLVYKQEWCEHTPSITVYVKDHEWMEVGAWVYEHFDDITGISFLPHSNHTYRQAPYQELSKEDWDAWVAAHPMPEINWTQLSEYEREDNTVSSQTLACVGGVCEI